MPRSLVRLLLAAGAVGALAACTTAAPAAGPTSSTPASASVTVPADGLAEPAPVADSAGPVSVLAPVPVGRVRQADGLVWDEPAWARPAPNSGFFSESEDSSNHVLVHSVDVSWSQLAPSQGVLDTGRTGAAQGMSFASLDDQLAVPGQYWMRLFASGADWAPAWVAADCTVRTYGPDYDGEKHLPVWDECVWRHLLDTYRALFVDHGLARDPRLRFVYVPGAFTWAEFDYDVIADAVKSGDLDFAAYDRWYSHAWTDLASLFGPYRGKLVFTGEDYPFGPFTAEQQDLLATRATAAGLGIRDGITEESNFHLSEAPSYGSKVQADGHLSLDLSLPVHDGKHVVATENECYDDCGFSTDDVPYAVVQSNLKALQLGVNWMYVVPGPSAMDQLPAHWDWVRLSLGRTPATAPDVWADLRDAEDTYWSDPAPPFTTAAAWPARPWVRNLEHGLVQRDVLGGVARRAQVDVRRHVLTPENGIAYEGLSTDVAHGQRSLYLDADAAFVGTTTGEVEVLVTYWDAGGPFRVRSGGASTAVVTPSGRAVWRTATMTLDAAGLDGSLAGSTDLALDATSSHDISIRLVRIVRLSPPNA